MLLDFFNVVCFYSKYLKIKVLTVFILAVASICFIGSDNVTLHFLAPAHRGFISVSNLKSIKNKVKASKRKIISYSRISDIIDRRGKLGIVIKYMPDGVVAYFIDNGGNLAGVDSIHIPYTFDLSSKSEFMHSLVYVYEKIERIYDIKPVNIGALYVLADTPIPYDLDDKVTDPSLDISQDNMTYLNEIEKSIKGERPDQSKFEITIFNTFDLRCIGEAALNFGDIFTGLDAVFEISEIKHALHNFHFAGDFGERVVYPLSEISNREDMTNEQDLASVLAVPSIINDIITSFVELNGRDALLNWLGLDHNYSQIRYLLQKRSYYNEATSYYTISDTEKYSAIYLKLKHKIASGEQWINTYMNKLLADLGSLCGTMLNKYPNGYYIALKIDEKLNFGVIPMRNNNQESKIIISGDFLGEFLALNDIEGEEFIKVIRANAGISPDSRQIINSSYSTSVDSYSLSVIFSDYRKKKEAQGNLVEYRGSRDFKGLDLVDNKYSFLNYIARASEFFAQKYGISLGDDATVYMRIGRNSVIGRNIKINKDCNFIISSDDYKRSKIYLGNNLSIQGDIDVTVRGAGKVIFADNAVIQKDITVLVPETSVAFINTEGIALYPKNTEDILTESFNLLLNNTLTNDGKRFTQVINTIYDKVMHKGTRLNQVDIDFLYTNLSVMLSQREADFLLDLFVAEHNATTKEEFKKTVDRDLFGIYPFFKVAQYTVDLKQNPVSNMLYRYKTVGKGESSEHIIEQYMLLDEFRELVQKVNELINDLKEHNKIKYFTLADYKLSTILDRAT